MNVTHSIKQGLIIGICLFVLSVVFVIGFTIYKNNGEIPETPEKFVDTLLMPAQIEAQYNGDKYASETEAQELPKIMTRKWFEENFIGKDLGIKAYDEFVVSIRTEPIFPVEHELYYDVLVNTPYNNILGFMRDFVEDKDLKFDERRILNQSVTSNFYASYIRAEFGTDSKRTFDFYMVQLDENKEDELTFFVREVVKDGT